MISYSAYLWHQPLFAFTRHASTTEVGTVRLLGLSAASLALAYVSWRYVEQPFRSPQRISRRRVVAVLGGTAAAVIAVAATAPGWARSSIAPNVRWESLGAKIAAEGAVCTQGQTPGYPGVATCEFGDLASRTVVALYGDSHADSIHDTLDKTLRRQGLKGVRLSATNCYIVPHALPGQGVTAAAIDACRPMFETLLRYIRDRVKTMIVINRWSFRLYPVPGEIEELTFTNSEGGAEPSEPGAGRLLVEYAHEAASARMAKEAALSEFVSALLSTDKRVLLVYPVPEIGWNIARVNFNYYHSRRALLPALSIDRDDFTRRNNFVNRVLDQFVSQPNFVAVRPERIFCDTFLPGRCAAQFDTVPFYYDNNHVSDAGARLIVDALLPHLPPL